MISEISNAYSCNELNLFQLIRNHVGVARCDKRTGVFWEVIDLHGSLCCNAGQILKTTVASNNTSVAGLKG